MNLIINSNDDHYRDIIIKGFKLLQKTNHYKQIAIVNKLKYLKIDISKSTLSNILNKHPVGTENLFNTSKGIQEIIASELGYAWSKDNFILTPQEASWVPKIIPELSIKEASLIMKPGFLFSEEGRHPLNKKVELLSQAKKEVIELGVTMRTYTSHFFSRNDAEFKTPIVNLLKKGVNIKCYLLNPDSNEARLYFEDRGQFIPEEKNGIEVIKQSLKKLRQIMEELNANEYPGKFEVYIYKHIPNNHFMSIDGGTRDGTMLIAPYIFGELRAKCPVIEFTKRDSPLLFRRYFDSLSRLTKAAKPITIA